MYWIYMRFFTVMLNHNKTLINKNDNVTLSLLYWPTRVDRRDLQCAVSSILDTHISDTGFRQALEGFYIISIPRIQEGVSCIIQMSHKSLLNSSDMWKEYLIREHCQLEQSAMLSFAQSNNTTSLQIELTNLRWIFFS